MPPRRTFKVTLAYDGAAFHGFARQPDRVTVEGVLLEALAPFTTFVSVAGRTDRGVSATGQVVSFHTRARVELEDLRAAIDRAAPDALVTRYVEEVPRWFHAAFSAVGRVYVYFVDTDVDATRVDRMLCVLAGRRDFSAFARDTRPGQQTVRHLWWARARRDRRRLRVDLAADGFLRRQVRVLTATALAGVEAGAPDDHLLSVAATRDRLASAPALPPEGLYLERILY